MVTGFERVTTDGYISGIYLFGGLCKNTQYVAPIFKANAYNCPHCGAYAHQEWSQVSYPTRSGDGHTYLQGLALSTGACSHYTLWIHEGNFDSASEGTMIYPASSTAPLPIEDIPDDVKEDFIEAREVVNTSPRSAAALLRLALQKLMVHLGEKGKNINDDIGSLVNKGLPVRIQQALDAVRVIGNNAVHPGQIDLKDDRQTALALFELLNMIVEAMITQPKMIHEIYNKIPESTKQEIGKRDGKA